jgi:hypothetical protein
MPRSCERPRRDTTQPLGRCDPIFLGNEVLWSNQHRPDIAARVSQRQDLDDWLARSPLVEIVFDDERLRTPG